MVGSRSVVRLGRLEVALGLRFKHRVDQLAGMLHEARGRLRAVRVRIDRAPSETVSGGGRWSSRSAVIRVAPAAQVRAELEGAETTVSMGPASDRRGPDQALFLGERLQEVPRPCWGLLRLSARPRPGAKAHGGRLTPAASPAYGAARATNLDHW